MSDRSEGRVADLDAVRAVPLPGDGWLLRTEGLILVLTGDDDAGHRLIEHCRNGSRANPVVFLRRIAYLLGEPEYADLAGFCLLLAMPDGRTQLLGSGEVPVVLADGEQLHGSGRLTWTERRVETLAGLSIGPSGDSVDPRIDVERGLLRAGGVTLASRSGARAGDRASVPPPAGPPPAVPPSAPPAVPPAAQPAMTAEPEHAVPDTPRPAGAAAETGAPGDQPRPAFEAVLLIGEPATPSGGQPLPGVEQGEQAADQELVDGIVCSRGHFNDPDSAYCTVCGISMVHRTHEFVSAPRPPLGVLIFDDGSAFSVDGDYVVGREPELSADVTSGAARPLSLNDRDNAVSRIHARLRLQGWAVAIEDQGSANGTFVADATDNWLRLDPGTPRTLAAGQRVRFGHRVAIFESHIRQR